MRCVLEIYKNGDIYDFILKRIVTFSLRKKQKKVSEVYLFNKYVEN